MIPPYFHLPFNFIGAALWLGTMILATPAARAQKTWNGSVSNAWGGGSNWSPSAEPGVADAVLFNDAAAPGNPIILGGSKTIGSFAYAEAGNRAFSTTGGPHSITILGATIISNSAEQVLTIGNATPANDVNLITNSLTKNGGGELILFGGSASGTIGAVTVNGGTLTTRNALSLGTATANLTLNGTLRLISGINRPIALSGSSVIENLSDNVVRGATMKGGTGGSGALTIRSVISSASGSMTFTTNPLNHNGDLILENSGVGTSASAEGTLSIFTAIGANVSNVTISNTTSGVRGEQKVRLVSPNLYTGSTTINADARLEILAENIIPDTSIATVNGTLDLLLFDETFGALHGGGSITKATENRTLTIGSGGGDGSFTGVFNNGTDGTLSVMKTGIGTQTFSGASSHSGGTTLSQGIIRLSNTTGSATGNGSVQVSPGATLTGSGSASGVLNVEGKVNPGFAIGTLTIGGNASFLPGATLRIGINDASAPKNDRLAIGGTLSSTASTLDFEVAGSPSQAVYVVATYTGAAPSGFTATNVPAGYKVNYAYNGNSIALINTYLAWAHDPQQGLTVGVNDAKADDPDHDGESNILEFATNGDPLSGATNPRVRAAIVDTDPSAGVAMALTLTLPVRSGVVFSGPGDLVSAPVDGVVYRIGASGALLDFTSAAVAEVTGNASIILELGLSAPDADWTYRTFRAPGVPGTTSSEFIRAGVN